MPSYTLVRCLQIVTLSGVALTALKLYKTGLRARYPVFFWYFAFWTINGTWPLFLPPASNLYYWLWVFTEPVNWLFYILVVRELCGLVLEKYQGLNTLGRWAIYAGIAISGLISVISVLPRIRSTGREWETLRLLLAADRGITLGLAIFLLLMLFLLRGYPVRLARNVLLHATLYSIFFVSNTLDSVLASMLGQQLYTIVDILLMSVSAICVLTWFLCLNPAGEEVEVNVPLFTPRHEERILYHLESLNAAMLKVSRK